ncbi:centromere protein T [Oryzias latipes]|uniref:centromere protein T n=1 Tax=Oryzias latipes TaxID=8090 RepID=UPI0005CB90EA|nr:centromere protein T [Oryzias latipes]
MDSTEDISARVLLKRILVDEPPRTPVTNSAFQEPGPSSVRYSARLRRKSAEVQTPQDIVRRSQRQKIRESISKKSLPPIKRRTASIRNVNASAASSILISDGDTPRHLLRNILQTEPLKSPVVHKRGPTKEPEPSSPDDGIMRTHPSIELSGLDLPDLTFRNAESTIKVLGRKRPRRSLNITAFEKRLKDGDDEEREHLSGDHSSLSLSSSTSLSLKTPFVDIQTEKKVGLRRRVSSRRKVTEEEFGAAIDKQIGGVHHSGLAEKTLGDTAHIEGFTLGLSKLGEPDITTDIVTCSTALYNQQDAMTSNFSMIANQDKSTVLASQLQREIEQSCLRRGDSVHADAGEAEAVIKPEHIEEEGFEAEGQNGESNNQSDSVPELSEPEEEEGAAGSPTKEELGAIQSEDVETSSQDEEEAAAPHSQTEEEGEHPSDSQTEEEGERPSDSQTEEEGERPTDPQTEEDGEHPTDSQTEEDGKHPTDSQIEEEGERPTDSQTEEDAAEASSSPEEEHGDPRSHSDQDDQIGTDFADFQDEASGQSKNVEAESSSEEDENAAECQSEDFSSGAEEVEVEREQPESDLEHITRQADGFTRTFILPVSEVGQDLAQTTAAGWSNPQSKTKTRLEVGSPDSSWKSGRAQAAVQESVAGREEPFHLLGLTQDIEDDQHQSDSPPEEAQAQDAAEQEEEWEDEDDGEESHEFSGKTPAFVKERRTFFEPDSPTLTPLSKNVQLSVTNEVVPPAKPKQARKKRTKVSTGKGVLPKAYLMSVFRHFSKTKVSPDVYPVLNEIMNKFFDRMAQDLETYAAHAKRKTIDVEDAILLLRRQGYVNDKVPVEVLIEKYLRMEQRKLLIPIATSGNVVVPKKRR